MSVYVDDMRAPYRGMIMCHMIADTDEELHAMADTIGVARKWFQGDHYDICLTKRAKAVSLGAVELTMRELAKIAIEKRRKRRQGGMQPPQTSSPGNPSPPSSPPRKPPV